MSKLHIPMTKIFRPVRLARGGLFPRTSIKGDRELSANTYNSKMSDIFPGSTGLDTGGTMDKTLFVEHPVSSPKNFIVRVPTYFLFTFRLIYSRHRRVFLDSFAKESQPCPIPLPYILANHRIRNITSVLKTSKLKIYSSYLISQSEKRFRSSAYFRTDCTNAPFSPSVGKIVFVLKAGESFPMKEVLIMR